jgi:F-type H+-transporting ATPase subunit epsilon
LEKLINLEIVGPNKQVFSGKVISVTAPGILGEFQILYNHATLVSNLVNGRIKIIDSDNQIIIFALTGGILEVKNNNVSILAESIFSPEEIDVEKISNQLLKAKSELLVKGTDKESLFEEISQARTQLKIADKK